MAFRVKLENKSGFSIAALFAAIAIVLASAVWFPAATAEEKDTKTQKPKVEKAAPPVMIVPGPKVVSPTDPAIKEPVKPAAKEPSVVPGVTLDKRVVERPMVDPGRLKIDPDLLKPVAPPPLFGYADLHTHPASFLGFGGQSDGKRGMMWGRPAVGATRTLDFAQRYGTCAHENHAPGFDEDPIRKMVRDTIISVADGRTRYPHGPNSAGSFPAWPHSLVLSHQQIDVPWLERAHQGGLRLMVAATVDNEVISTLHRTWDLGKTYEIARALLQGRDLRPFLLMPRPNFAYDSSVTQIAFIRQMVSENSDWMEIALTGADARRIISEGKLAIVLAVEMDSLEPAQILRLVNEQGVRLATPIHFVDNSFGGAAAYSDIFSLLNGIVGRADASSGAPSPYELIADSNLDFRINRFGGVMAPQIESLTNSALRWRPVGTDCPPTAPSMVREADLGCPGSRNAKGLVDHGRAIEDLIRAGAMVDMAHMSELSTEKTLDIAERLSCPVVYTHGDSRPDGFAVGASERSIRESELDRLFALGGVMGLGTGPGDEFDEPDRVYFNYGNPLIELAGSRNNWTFDLRQVEANATFRNSPFTRWRTTVRIGQDNVEGGNPLVATLMTSSGSEIGSCNLNPGNHGVNGGAVLGPIECTLSRSHNIADVRAVKLKHSGGCNFPCTGDNVDIEELRVEALTGDARGWLTLVQRTGGREGEVVRLKGAMSLPSRIDSQVREALASEFYVTHLLPRPRTISTISSLRIATFTNEDDLLRSGAAVFSTDLSGHRTSVKIDLNGGGTMPSGTLSSDTLTLSSGRETLKTLTAFRLRNGHPDAEMLNKIIAIRAAASRGAISPLDLDFMVGGLAAIIGSAAPMAMADPVTAGLGLIFSGLLADAGIDPLRDNWSTRIAVWANTTPLLVGYLPTQRLKGQQPDALLYRGLPDGIVEADLYSGIILDYILRDDLDDGNKLEFSVSFADGSRYARRAARGVKLSGGKEYRAYIPFDRQQAGRDFASFSVSRTDGTDIRLRSLDIGVARDPMGKWGEEYLHLAARARVPGQIALGTDLSGFEALLPFTAAPLSYPFNIETIAGRTDPARSALSVPALLGADRLMGGRVLSVKTDGISTVGQLPDFVASAHLLNTSAAGSKRVGPELFSSADAYVKSWERLDTIRGADRCTP